MGDCHSSSFTLFLDCPAQHSTMSHWVEVCSLLIMHSLQDYLLQLIFLGLPSAQFSCTKLSCFAPISSPCQRAPQGARNMPGSMCKGSLKHVTYPLAPPKMPKACMIWTQNMTRNAEVKQNGAKGRQEKKLQQFSCID